MQGENSRPNSIGHFFHVRQLDERLASSTSLQTPQLASSYTTTYTLYTSEFLWVKAFFNSRSTTRCVIDRLLRLLSFSLRSFAALFLREERLRFITDVVRLSFKTGSSGIDVREEDNEDLTRSGGWSSTFSGNGFARDIQLARRLSSKIPPQVSKTPSAKRTKICARVSYCSS